MGKFKPIDRKSQSKEQKEKVDFINHQWTDHLFVENYHGQWELNLAMFEGNQYTYLNEETNQLENITNFVERPTKNVYNRIAPTIRATWGELQYPHDCYVIPNTTESEDVKAARAGSMFIESSDANGHFKSKITMAKLYALIFGVCYWKEMWNPKGEGYIKNGKKWQKVSGEVDFGFINPFNCRPDPTVIDGRDWGWFIEGKRIELATVEEEFKLPSGSLTPASKNNRDENLFEREDFSRHDIEEVVRKEYWQPPTPDHPKGRYMVTAGDWLLYDGANPNPNHELGYFQLPGVVPKIGEPVDIAAVELMIKPQRQFNKYSSLIDQHIEQYSIKGMIPSGSLVGGNIKSWKRAGVDYVEYNPSRGTPHYQEPPRLPPTLIERLKFQENEIETESSVRKTSLGQLPKYAQRASGKLFEGLKNQDRMVLLPSLEKLDDMVSDSKRFRLELIQKHYGLKRMVKTTGRSKMPVVKAFKGAEINGNTDVRIKRGIDVLTNREKKEEVVMSFVNKGLIEDPKEALKLLDYKGIDEYMEDEFIDERQANRHVELLAEGAAYIKANPEDNHEVHYEIFNNFRKSDEFNLLEDKAQENIKKRIKEHKELLEGEAAKAREQEAPAEASPAPAPEEMAGQPGQPAPPSGAPPVAPPGQAGAGAPPAVGQLTPEELLRRAMEQEGGR